MLKEFRAITVQDLALRQKRNPDRIFCNHEVTRHSSFAAFQTVVINQTESRSWFSILGEGLARLSEFASAIGVILNLFNSDTSDGFERICHYMKTTKYSHEQLEARILSRERNHEENKARFRDLEAHYESMDRKFEQIVAELNLLKVAVMNLNTSINRIDQSLRGVNSPSQALQSVAQMTSARVLEQAPSKTPMSATISEYDPRVAMKKNYHFCEVIEEFCLDAC